MKKDLKQQGNELFFVQVKEPFEVRRVILESLKDILEMLQKFEKSRHVRHEKLMKIQKLRVLLKDANKLIGDLKAKLPQTSLKGAVAREEKPKKLAKKKEEHPKKSASELERLEAELSAIESKLKSFT